ncbi:hypothetical protein F3Y22_tig00003403pilonHSYRG00084 [Hibiscus syriacus]|uniref:J domain-containing protein n=1 Tax=Hibiscus syriacus TaxID=106335 RepID=A0A6A3CMH6_HIBSY|nr:hypothetical protein F3Y22_tig00003403pilonHSYRG00084 [Hibiscus syriacus]
MDVNKANALKSLKTRKNELDAGDGAGALKILRKVRLLDNLLTVAAYTEEQITTVKQIKEKKDYYDILGLEKTCSVEDVRKAYRRLSLKVHPDKTQLRGLKMRLRWFQKRSSA